ncbi:hypothetical protein MLD38_021913 [Melastoma candidum]|uniref:Uncharacterized protein n=1 Tax=Melastoma candidum TaxID=119954 RepID=A0ACB9QHI1_9MYRT|nr:hypothetical protein MLD38_021913 [Melastoma candidum]
MARKKITNAGVNGSVGTEISVESVKMVIETNYYGTKNITRAMIPLMRPFAAGARIVNVSSRLGRLNGRRNRIEEPDLRHKLGDLDTLTEEFIDNTVSSFVQQVDAEVNCYCPGWVKTAMTGWAGNVSPEEGADTGVWLALLPDEAVSGKFFAEWREIRF